MHNQTTPTIQYSLLDCNQYTLVQGIHYLCTNKRVSQLLLSQHAEYGCTIRQWYLNTDTVNN